jgi:photosystem II stability/assembly factor-like uncharacterized protein
LEEEFNLFALVMMNARHVCVAGDRGRVFVTQDAGETWMESASPLYDEHMMEGTTLYALAYDSGVLYAAGLDGVLIYSKDHGETWVERDSGLRGPELYGIDVVDGIGIGVGSGGNVIFTPDGGSSWKVLDVPEKVTRSWLIGIDLKKTPSGKVHGLVVGQDGTAALFRNGELTWQEDTSPRLGE